MTGRKGEALDENEAVAALRSATDSAFLGPPGDYWYAFLAALNDQDVVLVLDGPAEVAPKRPGGWVDGIGWVARLCDLNPYDIAHETEEGPQEADLVQMWTAHDRIKQVVIVTCWADGTIPKAGDR